MNRILTTAFVVFATARFVVADPVPYILKRGDTLSKLAMRTEGTPIYGKQGSLANLIAANPQIRDPNRVFVGQRLILRAPLRDTFSHLARHKARTIPRQVASAAPASTAATAVVTPAAAPRAAAEIQPDRSLSFKAPVATAAPKDLGGASTPVQPVPLRAEAKPPERTISLAPEKMDYKKLERANETLRTIIPVEEQVLAEPILTEKMDNSPRQEIQITARRVEPVSDADPSGKYYDFFEVVGDAGSIANQTATQTVNSDLIAGLEIRWRQHWNETIGTFVSAQAKSAGYTNSPLAVPGLAQVVLYGAQMGLDWAPSSMITITPSVGITNSPYLLDAGLGTFTAQSLLQIRGETEAVFRFWRLDDFCMGIGARAGIGLPMASGANLGVTYGGSLLLEWGTGSQRFFIEGYLRKEMLGITPSQTLTPAGGRIGFAFRL